MSPQRRGSTTKPAPESQTLSIRCDHITAIVEVDQGLLRGQIRRGAGRGGADGYAGIFRAVALQAAALGQPDLYKAAQKALQELLTLRPDFANSVRLDYEKWWDSKTI